MRIWWSASGRPQATNSIDVASSSRAGIATPTVGQRGPLHPVDWGATAQWRER